MLFTKRNILLISFFLFIFFIFINFKEFKSLIMFLWFLDFIPNFIDIGTVKPMLISINICLLTSILIIFAFKPNIDETIKGDEFLTNKTTELLSQIIFKSFIFFTINLVLFYFKNDIVFIFLTITTFLFILYTLHKLYFIFKNIGKLIEPLMKDDFTKMFTLNNAELNHALKDFNKLIKDIESKEFKDKYLLENYTKNNNFFEKIIREHLSELNHNEEKLNEIYEKEKMNGFKESINHRMKKLNLIESNKSILNTLNNNLHNEVDKILIKEFNEKEIILKAVNNKKFFINDLDLDRYYYKLNISEESKLSYFLFLLENQTENKDVIIDLINKELNNLFLDEQNRINLLENKKKIQINNLNYKMKKKILKEYFNKDFYNMFSFTKQYEKIINLNKYKDNFEKESLIILYITLCLRNEEFRNSIVDFIQLELTINKVEYLCLNVDFNSIILKDLFLFRRLLNSFQLNKKEQIGLITIKNKFEKETIFITDFLNKYPIKDDSLFFIYHFINDYIYYFFVKHYGDLFLEDLLTNEDILLEENMNKYFFSEKDFLDNNLLYFMIKNNYNKEDITSLFYKNNISNYRNLNLSKEELFEKNFLMSSIRDNHMIYKSREIGSLINYFNLILKSFIINLYEKSTKENKLYFYNVFLETNNSSFDEIYLTKKGFNVIKLLKTNNNINFNSIETIQYNLRKIKDKDELVFLYKINSILYKSLINSFSYHVKDVIINQFYKNIINNDIDERDINMLSDYFKDIHYLLYKDTFIYENDNKENINNYVSNFIKIKTILNIYDYVNETTINEKNIDKIQEFKNIINSYDSFFYIDVLKKYNSMI